MKRKRRMDEPPGLPCCNGKVCYPSEGVALHVLLRQSKRTGAALRVYYHHACRAWHLTSKPLQEATNG